MTMHNIQCQNTIILQSDHIIVPGGYMQVADNEVPCSDNFLTDFLKRSRVLSLQIVPSPENETAITETEIVSMTGMYACMPLNIIVPLVRSLLSSYLYTPPSLLPSSSSPPPSLPLPPPPHPPPPTPRTTTQPTIPPPPLNNNPTNTLNKQPHTTSTTT